MVTATVCTTPAARSIFHRLPPLFLFASFLLLTPLLLGSKANAQGKTVVEIGSGTLDRSKADGPRWKRINFDALATGTHKITVEWDSNADIRFSVFQLTDAPSPGDKERIGRSGSSSSPSTWSGTLDISQQYYLGIWSAEGSGNYTASVITDTTDTPDTTDSTDSTDANALAIVQPPLDLSVTEGDDAIFSVIAAGTGALKYQWLANGEIINGATDSSLIIGAVTLDDNGTSYLVEVTDDGNTVAFASATLTVEEPPVNLAITAQPADTTVREGDIASFSVTAIGNGTLSFQWFVDDEAIAGETSDRLLLDPTSVIDDGNVYRVTVSDENGILSSNNATLNVIKDLTPVTVISIGSGTVDHDENFGPRWVRVDFDSLASAMHTITVNWDSDADVKYVVHESNGTRISSTVKGSKPGIWNGLLDANKQYYLGLWSAKGVANYSAFIQAEVPLSIASQPSDMTVTVGSDATFTVDALGSGTLSYQWYADGAVLSGESSDSLTVFSAVLSESGTEYSVEVSNGTETITSQVVTLKVEAPLVTAAAMASWMMDESTDAFVMSDTSGNSLYGTIGADVVTGVSDQGATSYRWLFTPPTGAYQPERIVNVPHHPSLNPGSGDYSITMRYRTVVPFGNIIQKGQGGAVGGYWKIENPGGNLTCVFRGIKNNGDWNRKEVVSSRPLNDGEYHTVTCERVGTTLRLIVDGELDDVAGNSTGSIRNNQPISIGGKTNCNNTTISCDYFTGWIDEIVIDTP